MLNCSRESTPSSNVKNNLLKIKNGLLRTQLWYLSFYSYTECNDSCDRSEMLSSYVNNPKYDN